MQDKIKDLKTSILSQVKYFLEESGEFYPFASAITKDNRIKPIGAYFEGNYPSSGVVLKLLEEALFDGLNKKEFLLGAVGLDVLIDVDNGKKPALQIKVYDQEAKEISSTFYSYLKRGESYLLQEIGAS